MGLTRGSLTIEANCIDMIIGIVVTCFNNASTVERAFRSIKILREKIKNQKNLQIYAVAIDDDSSDGTKELIEKYFEENILDKYFNKKNNMGVSDSRNLGITFCASTDYIVFLDGDDELDERFSRALMDNNIYEDLIAFAFTHCNEFKQTTKYFFNGNIRLSNPKLLEYLQSYLIKPNEHSLLTTCWAKMYKTSIFFEDMTLRFKINLSVSEDTEFVFNFLIRCKQVSYINVPIYNHWLSHGKGNLKKATFGTSKDIVQLFSFLIALNTCRRLLLSRGLSRSQINPMIYQCIGAYTVIYTIRSCIHINSFRTFLLTYKQLSTIFKKKLIVIALNNYDSGIATGNRLLPNLIRMKLYFIATYYAWIVCRRRYG
jgi:glycosyltransferase involved in cell wall biosynthesis